MKKNIILIVVTLVIIVAVVMALIYNQNTNSGATKDYTAQDLSELVEKLYEGIENKPYVETTTIDIADENAVKRTTALNNSDDLDAVVASEAALMSQAYSMVLVKVKEGENVNTVKQEIFDSADPRKWICVGAEAVYVNNYDSVIVLIMANKELADEIYTNLTNIAGRDLGKKLEKLQ